MVDQESIKKIEELLQDYKYNWGKEVDFNCVPHGITQEKLVIVLEHIAETGESILAGWDKCFLAAPENEECPDTSLRDVPGLL